MNHKSAGEPSSRGPRLLLARLCVPLGPCSGLCSSPSLPLLSPASSGRPPPLPAPLSPRPAPHLPPSAGPSGELGVGGDVPQLRRGQVLGDRGGTARGHRPSRRPSGQSPVCTRRETCVQRQGHCSSSLQPARVAAVPRGGACKQRSGYKQAGSRIRSPLPAFTPGDACSPPAPGMNPDRGQQCSLSTQLGARPCADRPGPAGQEQRGPL